MNATVNEDTKRKREENSPESECKRSNKCEGITINNKAKINEEKMDEVKNMFAELIGEIKQIKENQNEQMEKMKKILEENEELKKEIKHMRGKLGILDTRVETLEREKRRNNLIIVGYEPQTKNNYELKYELEEFNREVLGEEIKIRNARRLNKETCMMEMESWEGKVKVLKSKSKLRLVKDKRIYINNDLTDREREIQTQLREIEKKEKEKGSATKMGYKKLTIDGVIWEWDERKHELVKMKQNAPKN